jgi:phage-related baseplate assembly protein
VRNLPPELAGLPKPAIVEEVSVDAILDRKITQLNGNFADAGLPYTVSKTNYDPAVIQLQGAALDEARLRQRVNEAARAQLLAFATGSTLDHVAALFDVFRMAGEDDDRLATRVALKNRDRNSAGSEPRYQYLAMTASIRVKDAVVYTAGRSPVIHVALLATDNDGVADQALLDQVAAAVDLRMANDTIEVEPAVRQVLDVAYDVWLLPDAVQADTLAAAEAALRAAWAVDGKLGRDFDDSYAVSKLRVAGIQRIAGLTPAGLTTVPFNQVAAIGTVTPSYRGRAY